jgi:hypothetical protein
MTKAGRKLQTLLENHGIRQDVARLLKQHRREQLHEQKTVIDLHGPDGNAFVIMATAQYLARQLGWSKEQIDSLLDDMRSGDYMNLIDLFEENFGDYVILKNRPGYRDEDYGDEDEEMYEGYQRPGDPGNWLDQLFSILGKFKLPITAILAIGSLLVAQGLMGKQDLDDRIEHHHLREARRPRKRR